MDLPQYVKLLVMESEQRRHLEILQAVISRGFNEVYGGSWTVTSRGVDSWKRMDGGSVSRNNDGGFRTRTVDFLGKATPPHGGDNRVYLHFAAPHGRHCAIAVDEILDLLPAESEQSAPAGG